LQGSSGVAPGTRFQHISTYHHLCFSFLGVNYLRHFVIFVFILYRDVLRIVFICGLYFSSCGGFVYHIFLLVSISCYSLHKFNRRYFILLMSLANILPLF